MFLGVVMGRIDFYTEGDFARLLSDAVKNRRFIVIVGSMEVYYTGRSSSKLSLGERICIVKPDGSVLVHRPSGYEPVNWQPSGSIVSFGRKDGRVFMKAVRKKPLETLLVYFEKIFSVLVADLVDRGVFSMKGDEEDMRKAIILEPDIVEAGLRIIDFERRIVPGFIDLYARDANGRLVVIELKKDVAGIDAVVQLKNYVDYVRKDVPDARGILVAPRLARNCMKMLEEYNLEFKRLTLEKCLKVLERQRGLDRFL